MMDKQSRLFLGLMVCAIGFFAEPALNYFNKNEKPQDTKVVDAPSLELKTLIDPIVKIDISKEDANFISCFYKELADVVSNDIEFIKTTGQLREFNTASGKLYFPTKLKNKYETLGEDIDRAMISAIGKENATMTSDKRNKAVNIFNAISWGVQQ